MSDAISKAIDAMQDVVEALSDMRADKPIREAIAELQALQSGEPSEWAIEVENGQVVISRIGADFTGYLYTTPQPVVPEGSVLVPVEDLKAIKDARKNGFDVTYMEHYLGDLLSAGKGGES